MIWLLVFTAFTIADLWASEHTDGFDSKMFMWLSGFMASMALDTLFRLLGIS